MSREKEIEAIRELQRDLRGKLDTLDRRIGELEKEETVAPPSAPSPAPEPKPSVAEIPVPPVVVPEPVKQPEPVSPKSLPPQSLTPPPLPKFDETPPTAAPPRAEAPPKESFELHFGRVWLVRIGIVILLTGLVFLGNFAWKEFVANVGPIGKLALIYLSGFGLAGAGWLVKRKRAELATYGKVLIAGGIATIYYATYAAHFVEPLRVITSPVVGGALLLTLAGGIIWLADRMRSQAVAAATTVLGFYTAAINPIAGFSLFSNLVLCLIAITLLVRRRWTSVSFLALVGCYLAFGFWRVHTTGTLWVYPITDPSLFWTALLFPACYWLVFTVAVFLGQKTTFMAGGRAAFLTINNGAFFGLAAQTIAGTYNDQLWIFALAFGAILLILAWLAAKREPDAASFDGAYLTQGLILIFVGLVFKFSGYQLALLLALQSGTLMKLSSLRHGKIFQLFSGLSAAVATGYAMDGFNHDRSHAGLAATSVALVLLGVAWLCKKQRGWLNPLSFKKRAAAFVALATVLVLQTISETVNDSSSLYVLLAAALVGTASIYLLRLPEVVYGAQIIAGAGLVVWFGRGDFTSLPPALATLTTVLVLMHWWQREKVYVIARWWRTLWESGFALAVVAVLGVWVFTRYETRELYLTPALSVSAFLVLAYAFATRAWPLAICGQIFSVVFVVEIVSALGDHAPWPVTMGALAGFLAQSGVIRLLGHRTPHPLVADWYATTIHAATVFLAIGAVYVYVPAEWRFVVLTGAAFILYGLGLTTHSRESLAYAALATVVGGCSFALANFGGDPPFAPNFAGLSLVLFAQQFGRKRLPKLVPVASAIQSVMIVAGVFGVWLLMHRLVAQVNSGFLITISWSLLAFIVLAAGFLLRERAYRLLGLALLVISVARVFSVDVWQLDTLYRILSFLVLGVVLLALGFLYNRFADLVRKWI